MTTKLYIDAIVGPGPNEREQYQVLHLEKVSEGELCKRFDIEKRIATEEEALKKELPEPTEKFGPVYDQWEDAYRAAYLERVSPLNNLRNDIMGPIEVYVVRGGNYEIGQILDEVPIDAVPVDD